MSNTEKKLDALIDALGFDVEVSGVTAGDLICRDKSSRYYSTKEIMNIYPGKHVKTECFGGKWIVSEPVAGIRLTKRNPKQAHNELIIELAQALYKHSVTAGMKMHTLNYNGTTLKYSFENGLMEIVTDEEI